MSQTQRSNVVSTALTMPCSASVLYSINKQLNREPLCDNAEGDVPTPLYPTTPPLEDDSSENTKVYDDCEPISPPFDPITPPPAEETSPMIEDEPSPPPSDPSPLSLDVSGTTKEVIVIESSPSPIENTGKDVAITHTGLIQGILENTVCQDCNGRFHYVMVEVPGRLHNDMCVLVVSS